MVGSTAPVIPRYTVMRGLCTINVREKFDFGLENTRDTDLSRYFVTEFF